MRLLTKAFKELEKKDYFAKRKLACCRSCASWEIPASRQNLFAYTTEQSDNPKNYFIYWSAPEDNPNEIIKVLKKHGLKVKKPKNAAFAIAASE